MKTQTKSRNDQTKTGTVIKLLLRKRGATLDDMVKATGWQPHTTRAALTRLRKKGHQIARNSEEGVSRYTIVEAAG